MADHTLTDPAATYIDGEADSLQEIVEAVAEQLTGKSRDHDTDALLDVLTESDGELVIRVRNVGATPYFRWHCEAEQFERIIAYAAPHSHPKHHRETPRETLTEYLGDCAPYTIQIVTKTETPFPEHTAPEWVYKWPRHSNEHCVYGVVLSNGLETWYFERVSSETDTVTLVGVERWMDDEPEQENRAVDIPQDAIPDEAISRLEERGLTYHG